MIALASVDFAAGAFDAIVAFYKTPAGIALLDKMPRINDQIEQLAHSRLVILQPQIRQAFDDFRKSQAPPPPAASPAAAPAAAPAPAATSPASAASKPSTSSPK